MAIDAPIKSGHDSRMENRRGLGRTETSSLLLQGEIHVVHQAIASIFGPPIRTTMPSSFRRPDEKAGIATLILKVETNFRPAPQQIRQFLSKT